MPLLRGFGLHRRSSRQVVSNTPTPEDPLPPGTSVNNTPSQLGRSSSTLNTAGSITPPSPNPTHASSQNLANGHMASTPPIPQRPQSMLASNRHSTLFSVVSSSPDRVYQSTSRFAPQVTSISDNSWVHQNLLLIQGTIGEPNEVRIDGTVTVNHHNGSFPSIDWPVFDSHFKALVRLVPGPNRIRFDFSSSKVESTNSSIPPHSSWKYINCLPITDAPPLQLAILLAKDSPGTFDATPQCLQAEGNGLDTAISKYKMAAYLWQTYTAEQMLRHGFGRRSFRFEEEWQTGTLTYKDQATNTMRNEAKIHIIRSEKTLAEIRDPNIAQQNKNASKSGDLYSIAMADVKRYFKPLPGQTHYVAVLILDSHWDQEKNLITGHAALGGGDGSVQLAIFGSHALHSYPSCLERVAPAFSDCTRTDTNYVANDCNESGSHWEAANIGIGAHLHEVGHLLGSPHQENGVMLRDYVRLNRSFVSREPYSTRTGSKGLQLCQPEDECRWHRLDTLRFRYHPCFRWANDISLHSNGSVVAWAIDGKLTVTARSGVTCIETLVEGDDICRSWMEYIQKPNRPNTDLLPREVSLLESDLRQHFPKDQQKKKIDIRAHSASRGEVVVNDLSKFLSKGSIVKLPNGKSGFRSSPIGQGRMDGSTPEELILGIADKSKASSKPVLTSIKVHHGLALDGLEFCYQGAHNRRFGKQGGSQSEFKFDISRSEGLLGFYVRAGAWIDGLQIVTTQGRLSAMFGNPIGGSGYYLIPPKGYHITGIAGSCAAWVDSFSLIVTQ